MHESPQDVRTLKTNGRGRLVRKLAGGFPEGFARRFAARFLPESFRFSPVITFVALILGVIMLIMSNWQWTRYKYKVRLLESFRLNSISTPLTFPPAQKTDHEVPGVPELIEKRVELRGVFDYGHQLIVTNREGPIGTGIAGVGPGHLLFTPLLLNGGEGPAVLVSRGFIPFVDREPETWKKYTFAGGEQRIEGVVQRPVKTTAFGPSNPVTDARDADGGPPPFQHLWFFEEIPAMAKQFPYPVLENLYVQKLGGPPAGEYPHEAVRVEVPPSTHFGYTIEWILLAISTWCLAFFFQCVGWRRREEYARARQRGADPGVLHSIVGLTVALSPFVLR